MVVKAILLILLVIYLMSSEGLLDYAFLKCLLKNTSYHVHNINFLNSSYNFYECFLTKYFSSRKYNYVGLINF